MMTFRVVHKPSNSHVRCPYRLVEQGTGREIDWINQYLDYETLRRLADATLRTYAHELLHFLRWWESLHHTVGLPALMKLLGHVNPEMTMRYGDVAGSDLQREFHRARSQARHLAPQPKAPSFSPRGGLDGVVDSLLFAQHAIEMFRRSLPNGAPKHRLDQLANRLIKILAETRQLNPDE